MPASAAYKLQRCPHRLAAAPLPRPSLARMRQLIMLVIRLVSIGLAFSGNIPLTVACMALQSAASSLSGHVTAARRSHHIARRPVWPTAQVRCSA